MCRDSDYYQSWYDEKEEPKRFYEDSYGEFGVEKMLDDKERAADINSYL